MLFDPIWASQDACREVALSGHLDYKICLDGLDLELADAEAHKWGNAALVGLAPIPLAWLLVWGLVALVRWIRRGFSPT